LLRKTDFLGSSLEMQIHCHKDFDPYPRTQVRFE
jgi:hypothetical protein